jgi:hypothetical protein
MPWVHANLSNGQSSTTGKTEDFLWMCCRAECAPIIRVRSLQGSTWVKTLQELHLLQSTQHNHASSTHLHPTQGLSLFKMQVAFFLPGYLATAHVSQQRSPKLCGKNWGSN